MESKILAIVEEQVAVAFTGRVNILSNFNHQFLGHLIFKQGEVLQASFQNLTGLKALSHIFIQELALQSFQFVIEPEVVENPERQIHLNFVQLKNKMSEVLKQHQASLKQRPPENVKILVDAEFLEDSLPVTAAEFEVLAVITEWSSPYDIYQHCSLLDHEITTALVGLRKKNALKILAPRNND